jgi:hypothetical protein
MRGLWSSWFNRDTTIGGSFKQIARLRTKMLDLRDLCYGKMLRDDVEPPGWFPIPPCRDFRTMTPMPSLHVTP